MPFYFSIRRMAQDERLRTVEGLIRLRAQLDDEMPPKTRNDTIVLGTWNIRNFDDNRFANGPRSKEDYFYIAEILSRFDVIAVQEICEDLGPLEDIMYILGREYDYILTDVTEGVSGNSERLGFIFDTAKVRFKGVAGELVLPDSLLIVDDERKLQFSRTPFMCLFQSGWFKFAFSTVHIYFGSDTGKKFARRVDEIEAVAGFLAKRAKNDPMNHILVGDFNIPKIGDKAFNALADRGFTVFQNHKGSNKDQTKFYDQISFMSQRMEVNKSDGDKAAGVLQFFDSIFREEDFPAYRTRLIEAQRDKIASYTEQIAEREAKILRARTESSKERHRDKIESLREAILQAQDVIGDDAKLKNYYLQEWRTFHGSDHLPLWVELKIDFSGDYLGRLQAS
ncbi:MAG: endonuclease/exonuclease/phosphatase family protein [Roseovarius sp.]|nr:endonuclease/exonuclease/phosphatase family protein [Roseovarius sp.]